MSSFFNHNKAWENTLHQVFSQAFRVQNFFLLDPYDGDNIQNNKIEKSGWQMSIHALL